MSEDANAHMRFIRITNEAELTALFDEAASTSRSGQHAGPGG
jgi:hypothetical protein